MIIRRKAQMKKILILLLVFCFIFTAQAEDKTNIQAGDIVLFGHYPQTMDGTDDTPIEWLVLNYDDVNHRVLLLSRYGIDCRQYDEGDGVTWETCNLRTWLNNDFLNRAFSKEERSAILLTEVDNSKSQGYSKFKRKGGKNTKDYLFLLSYSEANQYFGLKSFLDENPENVSARLKQTDYTQNKSKWLFTDNLTEDGSPSIPWWLRSPGDSKVLNCFVGAGGFLNHGNPSNYYGVRPAFWLDLDAANI